MLGVCGLCWLLRRVYSHAHHVPTVGMCSCAEAVYLSPCSVPVACKLRPSCGLQQLFFLRVLYYTSVWWWWYWHLLGSLVDVAVPGMDCWAFQLRTRSPMHCMLLTAAAMCGQRGV